jgi:hypothetical protein
LGALGVVVGVFVAVVAVVAVVEFDNYWNNHHIRDNFEHSGQFAGVDSDRYLYRWYWM